VTGKFPLFAFWSTTTTGQGADAGNETAPSTGNPTRQPPVSPPDRENAAANGTTDTTDAGDADAGHKTTDKTRRPTASGNVVRGGGSPGTRRTGATTAATATTVARKNQSPDAGASAKRNWSLLRRASTARCPGGVRR